MPSRVLFSDYPANTIKAIVDGEPPDLPEDGYSLMARDFVRGCLHKIPKLRPTYGMLLEHPWLATAPESEPVTVTEGEPIGVEDKEVADWVKNALERKRTGLMGVSLKPALHAAPLDTVTPTASPSASETVPALTT